MPTTANLTITIERVCASEIHPGDRIVVPSESTLTTVVVQTVSDLLLANPITDQVIATSNPETGHRWRVLHILTSAGGLVRFPHETVLRVTIEGQ